MANPGNCDSGFFVLIDEVENHLHPSMQRTILPNLLEAFPEVQFVVTTHSPFVVNSIEESSIFALKYNENKKIVSRKLDFEEKYSSAVEVLREILGVPVTIPIWAEKQIEGLVEKYASTLTMESYKSLKGEMENLGLDQFMPYTISLLSEETQR